MIGYHKVFNLDDDAAMEFWSAAKKIAGGGFVKVFAVCLGGDQNIQDDARKVFDEVAGRAHGESSRERAIYPYAGVGALIDTVVDGKQVSIPYVGHWTPPHWMMECLEGFENLADDDKSMKPGIDIIVGALLKRCEIEISAGANWVAVVERGVDVEALLPSFNTIITI